MGERFLDTDGSVSFGQFEAPIGTVNYRDYPLRSSFREILPEAERDRRFVHFHFLGFTSKRFIAGCSLTLANNQKTAFFYLFDRRSGVLLKKGCRVGDGDQGEINLDPDNGVSLLSGKGLNVRFESTLQGRIKHLHVTIDNSPVLDMSFSETASDFETLRLCTPTAANGWSYCQKVAGIEAQGELVFEGIHYDLSALGASAHHDFTAGFLRRDTFWNWACIMGHDAEGRHIGLNLSNGVNETGASENVIWVDGKRDPVGLFTFEYDLDDLSRNWTINSDDGATKLRFTPEGCYAAFNNKIECGFDFHQLFGSFSGHVKLANGDTLSITELPGFCERQYTVWWPEQTAL